MVHHSQFGGSALEDPHEHIRTFLEYCNTLKQNGVPPDAIRLSLFPFYLRDGARLWLHSLPADLTDTSKHLLQAFLQRYFPPTKQQSSETRLLDLFSMMVRACMMLGRDTIQ